MKYAINFYDESNTSACACPDFDLITEEGKIYQFYDTGEDEVSCRTTEVEGTITHYSDEVWEMISDRNQWVSDVTNTRSLEDVLADFGITSSDEKVSVDEINEIIKNVELYGCRNDEEYDYFTSKQDTKEIE